MWGTTGRPNFTCPTLSRSALLTVHFLTFRGSWLFHQLVLRSSEQPNKLLTLTCTEDTENKISLSLGKRVYFLASCFAGCVGIYFVLPNIGDKFRRNSGATHQFSAVYHKWSCPAGQKGGPVSHTRCREPLTTRTHTTSYIKGPP